MTDIFDYLMWRGDLTLEQSKFNEVDGVILSRFTYAPFEAVLGEGNGESSVISIAEFSKRLFEVPDIQKQLVDAKDEKLIKALAASKRFADMEISAYVNHIDLESQTQFAAITVNLDESTCFLAFRGTDSTLVGWKEDFNMSFVFPVPAQQLSVEYLEKIADRTNKNLITGGHSKGGNLAVYSAAFCREDIKERILSIYNYDGPGFDRIILEKEEYQRIYNKIQTYVPQSSIVGMLLGHEEKYQIVHSNQMGILQHDTYSWEVQGKHFVCVETVDSSSRFMDYTLKEWIGNLDYAQRAQFIDTIYYVLAQTNVLTLNELAENWIAAGKVILQSGKNLDEPTRKAVSQTLLALVQSAKKSFAQMRQEEAGAKWIEKLPEIGKKEL